MTLPSTASPTAVASWPSGPTVTELGSRLAEMSARVAEAESQHDKLASQLDALDQRSQAVGARVDDDRATPALGTGGLVPRRADPGRGGDLTRSAAS